MKRLLIYLILFCTIINNFNAQEHMKNREVIIRANENEEDFPAPNSHEMFNKYFFTDGEIIKEREINIPYTGIIKVLFFNGDSFAIWNYKGGVKDGEQLIYGEHNILRSRLMFVDGIVEGRQYSYYNNGNIFVSNTYVKGNRDGKTQNYYENGNLESFGNEEGNTPSKIRRIGYWIYYYKNGNKKEEGNWGKKG